MIELKEEDDDALLALRLAQLFIRIAKRSKKETDTKSKIDKIMSSPVKEDPKKMIGSEYPIF